MATVDIIQLLKEDNGEKFYPVTHAKAVIGLKDSSFFEIVEDTSTTPATYSVKLRDEYAGLWANGWIFAGGVGSDGGGGGGLIETVYTWTELQAMASAPADDVTAAVNARGVYEIWQAVKALQDEPAGIVSITSQQDGTVDFTFGNGDITTVDLNHRHPDLEAAIAAIQSLDLIPVVVLPTASEDTIGKIYLVPSSNPKTENVKDEYVTIRSGSEGAYTYSWEQIGTTAVDLTPYATKVTGATSGNFASLDASGNLVDSGHKHGDYITSHQTVTNLAATLTPDSTQTIATIGNTSITVKVPYFAMQQDVGTLNSYFTNGVANNAARLDGHSASYFATEAALNGYVPTSRTINGVDLSQNRTFYALGTSLGTSAARGTMLGVSALSYDLSSTGSESSLIKWDTQLGAWHVYGNLYADGWVASGGIGTESGGGGYGVEEITSNQDGTVDFHFTGGDITTIDLNHEHPQYPKYVLCADEAAYNAIANKDSSTLYLIPPAS